MFVALLEGLLMLILSVIIKASEWQMANVKPDISMIFLNVVVNYFLVPTCVSAIFVFYYNYNSNKKTKHFLNDWLLLRMSWFSFYLTLPLFFISYGAMLLKHLYPKIEMWFSLGSLFGFFEIISF